MADNCCESACGSETAKTDPRWWRVLWAALSVNAGMFLVEMAAGAASDSRALQADALDFLGDAANYAVSLAVVGMALTWRARAALLKSLFMLGFAGWVLGSAVLAFVNDSRDRLAEIAYAMTLSPNPALASSRSAWVNP